MATNPIIILLGPSGVGKSTFLQKILFEYPQFRDIVTCTTRQIRKGEEEGKPYYFLTRLQFEKMIQEDHFVEWAEVHGHLYGSPRKTIEETWKKGLALIVDLDIQGARSFKKKYPQALTVFIHPPSIDELRRRICHREEKVPKDLNLRLENAKKEIAVSKEFDRQVMNSDFDQCYGELKKIIDGLIASS